MFRNYLLVAVRTLFRHKANTAITIGGLSFALAVSFLIGLFVIDEFGYDQHNEKADRLFRVVRSESTLSSGPMGPALQTGLAGVEAAVRLDNLSEALIVTPDGTTFQSPVHFADSTYFDLFTHEFVRGSAERAMAGVESAVITRSSAMAWFGSVDVLGEQFTVRADGAEVPLFVSAVIEDVPRRAHFHFNVLASFELVASQSNRMDNWTTNWLYTYILAAENTDPSRIEEQLQPFIEESAGGDLATFFLQPVTDIHLKSGLGFEMEPQGSIQRVLSLAAIGLLILIIACVNFMNMVISWASDRVREIGMRRTIGANPGQLFVQFLGESVLVVLMAGVAGWILAAASLPTFNEISGKEWTIASMVAPNTLSTYLAAVLLLGIAAGTYPSLFLSSLQTSVALKGILPSRRRTFSLQTLTLGAQFAISTFLIAATIVTGRQMSHLTGRDLGFEGESRVVIPLESSLLQGREMSIRSSLESIPDVVSVSFTNDIPGQGVSDFVFRPEGSTDVESQFSLDTWFVDESMVETLGLTIVAGRDFDADRPTDRAAFLLNESAARLLAGSAAIAWDDPLGKRLDFLVPGSEGWQPAMSGPVVGIVEDFHYLSLHESIGPLAMIVAPQAWDTALIEVRSTNIPEVIREIEAIYSGMGTDRPFEFHFLDDQLDALYKAEMSMGKLVGILSVLAIVLACLGLFAQASHTVQNRRREIGVRKAFGASAGSIVRRFTRRYAVLVALAGLLALPVAFVSLSKWLDQFAYRIDLSADMFILSMVISLLLAMVAIVYQAVRAALTDPAAVLKGD